jgi:hypothetical protein
MSPHSGVPATVANLDLAVVGQVLARHACNVTDAARDLGVPASDLRRLLWANPKLQDGAFEVVEARLDTAEKNIAEALKSEDSRRRDAASFFVLRNTVRAKRRGWITSSVASLDMTVNANLPPRQIVYRWRNEEDDKRDAEAAEVERLHQESKTVIGIGWGALTAARPSSTRPTRSLRTTTEILVT